jgi:hypothetical protein
MITLTSGDRDQRPDKRSHHRVAEGIGADGALDVTGHETARYASTSQLEQGPDRAGSLPAATESTEIPQSNQGGSFLVQPSKIDFGVHPSNLIPVERIRRYACIAQSVDVAPPNRAESGIEARRSG